MAGTLLIQAHSHSSRHRATILKSDTCGCFFCLALFTPAAITAWTDDGATALCPRCGTDSVLGSASGYPVEADFLTQMRARWFGR
jgi:hypothetical protein